MTKNKDFIKKPSLKNDISKPLEKKSESIEDLLINAERFHISSNFEKAKELYLKIKEIDPSNKDAFFFLRFINHYEYYIDKETTEDDLKKKYQAAGNYLSKGKKREAEFFLREIIAAKPDWAEACNNLGVLYQGQNRTDEALICYKRVLAIKKDWDIVYLNIGNTHLLRGEYDLAEKNINEALKINPEIHDAYFALGNLYLIQQKFSEAENSYSKFLEYRPVSIKANFNLAYVLAESGKFEESIEYYKKTLEIKSDFPEAMNNLADTFYKIKDYENAIKYYQKALSIQPKWYQMHYSLACSYLDYGEINNAIKHFKQSINLEPGWGKPYIGLLDAIKYESDLNNEDWKNALKSYAEMFIKYKPSGKSDNIKKADKKLRIGYLIGNSISRENFEFFEILHKFHDKNKFDIFCYSIPENNDAIKNESTKKVLPGKFKRLENLTDSAKQIQQDMIDILVTSADYSDLNCMAVSSFRPAPVVVSWMGMPGSSGLSCFDYRFSTEDLTPHGVREYFSESIWRLDKSVFCFKIPSFDLPISPLPCLRNGFITFSGRGELNKITRMTTDLWINVMKKYPESKIKIFTETFDNSLIEKITDIFQKSGIASYRIEFINIKSGKYEHILQYKKVDIALDTYPFNGISGTMEAIYMGVPVISLSGNRVQSRYGLMILNKIGLPELIAFKPDDYLNIVSKLVKDTKELSKLRNMIREKLIDSELCDYSKFTGSFENAYKSMWENWCNK